MVLVTKIVIAVVAVGLAVPLTTNVQKQTSATKAADPLIGRWQRHVNIEPIKELDQYIELKSGQRYSFGSYIKGRYEEEGFGTWRRAGKKVVFKADPNSKMALILDEAELVDGATLQFTPFHAYCKRKHPHEPTLSAAGPTTQPGKMAAVSKFRNWLQSQPKHCLKGKLFEIEWSAKDKRFEIYLVESGPDLTYEAAKRELASHLARHGLVERDFGSQVLYLYSGDG